MSKKRAVIESWREFEGRARRFASPAANRASCNLLLNLLERALQSWCSQKGDIFVQGNQYRAFFLKIRSFRARVSDLSLTNSQITEIRNQIMVWRDTFMTESLAAGINFDAAFQALERLDNNDPGPLERELRSPIGPYEPPHARPGPSRQPIVQPSPPPAQPSASLKFWKRPRADSTPHAGRHARPGQSQMPHQGGGTPYAVDDQGQRSQSSRSLNRQTPDASRTSWRPDQRAASSSHLPPRPPQEPVPPVPPVPLYPHTRTAWHNQALPPPPPPPVTNPQHGRRLGSSTISLPKTVDDGSQKSQSSRSVNRQVPDASRTSWRPGQRAVSSSHLSLRPQEPVPPVPPVPLYPHTRTAWHNQAPPPQQPAVNPQFARQFQQPQPHPSAAHRQPGSGSMRAAAASMVDIRASRGSESDASLASRLQKDEYEMDPDEYEDDDARRRKAKGKGRADGKVFNRFNPRWQPPPGPGSGPAGGAGFAHA